MVNTPHGGVEIHKSIAKALPDRAKILVVAICTASFKFVEGLLLDAIHLQRFGRSALHLDAALMVAHKTLRTKSFMNTIFPMYCISKCFKRL